MKVLFLCSQNRLRSPTAEAVFCEYPGVDAESAGLNRGADNPVSGELIGWADIIFVMERRHKSKLSKDFKPYLKNSRVITLDIPDDYDYMDAALVKRLKRKVTRYLVKT
ncbi:MAG: low molecular weight protein tyrosine phosphatase family protein [Gammaproteobacteria bacterium]